jgi:hypothetical protein
MSATNLIENLRSTFASQLNSFLMQQSRTYRDAAQMICTNDKLQQDIFDNLIAISQTDDLVSVKKFAANALHATEQLDSSLHFLLSYRTSEQKAREMQIENLNSEFNKTVDLLATQLKFA